MIKHTRQCCRIYYDFESILRPNKKGVKEALQVNEQCTCGRTFCRCIFDDLDTTSENLIEFHEPVIFSVCGVSSWGELIFEHCELVDPREREDGKTAPAVLLDYLLEHEIDYQNFCKGDKPLVMSEQVC